MVDLYFNIYKDEIFAVRLCHQISTFFPKSKILIISDGPCYEKNIDLIKSINSNVIFIEGERLKNKPEGGCEFTQRNFEKVLELTNNNTIIKLDPDSYIWRTPNFIPEVPWFGTVHNSKIPFFSKALTFIAGGAMGFQRQTIEMIYNSKLLLNKRYDNVNSFYDRYKRYKKIADPSGESGLVRLEDWTLADVCDRLDITPTNWNDIYCVQIEEQIQDHYNYSITHPVRTIF